MVIAAIFLTLPLCLAFAAFTDLLSMTIPNRIPLILLLSFFVVAPFSGMDWQTFAMSLAAAAAVFFACFALFAANVMGGGDCQAADRGSRLVWFQHLPDRISAFSNPRRRCVDALHSAFAITLAGNHGDRHSIPDSLLVAKRIPYGIGIAIAGLLTYGEAPLVKAAIASLS